MKYEDINFMEDISQNTYNKNDVSLLMASSIQMSQNKDYLVRKTTGVKSIYKFIINS
jgi:hypothetical protein